MSQKFSDEFINSYLDNELDMNEREELLEALRYDTELSTRVCRLKNVKDMVQLAYQSDNFSKQVNVKQKNNRYLAPAVAASILFIGVTLGWFANSNIAQQPSLLELAKTAQLPHQPALQKQKNWRLMLHVSSYDPKRYGYLLHETEELLKTSLQNNEKVQIEMLTNGPGLALMKAQDESFTRKLTELANKYDNFRLLACEKALKRLKVEKGIDLKLVPEATTVNSALHHVIQRQKEGWSYINI
jgi:intracellular sulfur oxidation DsrE/DsrF family protein